MNQDLRLSLVQVYAELSMKVHRFPVVGIGTADIFTLTRELLAGILEEAEISGRQVADIAGDGQVSRSGRVVAGRDVPT